jgi:ribosome-associated protein
VRDGLRKSGASNPIGAEGEDSCHWVLIDYGDIIVHVFHAPVREFYDLDGFWADAPRIDAAEPAGEAEKTAKPKRAATGGKRRSSGAGR